MTDENVSPKQSPTPAKYKGGDNKHMTFPQAIAEVIKGNHVTKAEWGDEKVYLYLGDFLYIKNPPDQPDFKAAPLKVSAGDMQGKDWYVV